MKIICIGDFHLHPWDYSKSKEYNKWMCKVYDKAIEYIKAHIERESPNIIVYMGDILDLESPINIELDYLSKLLSIETDAEKYWIDGNHNQIRGISQTAYWGELAQGFLEKHNVTYVSDKLHLKDIDALIVGHGSIKSLETYRNKHKLLFSHLRYPTNMWSGEIDVENMLNKFDQICLGDLHGRYIYDEKVYYTGNVIDTSFKQEDSQPSILMWEDGEFTWLDTLKNKYRKKLIVCEDVEEVLSLDIPNDTNWYKIKVTDTALNLKRLPKLPNVTYDKKSKELEAKEEIQFVKDAVTDLRTVSIEKSFIEFCELQNTRKECSDMLEAKIAGMEKIEDD